MVITTTQLENGLDDLVSKIRASYVDGSEINSVIFSDFSSSVDQDIINTLQTK